MSKYIVKNCPCLKLQISYKDKLWINGCSELGEIGNRMCCQDITDCVIKQVVEKFNEALSKSNELDFADFKQYFDEDFAFSIPDIFKVQEVEK